MSRFEQVQAAFEARRSAQMNSQHLAQQIVAAAHGNDRLAYEFIDTLNRNVTLILQDRKQ
jgi:hypothetical protein